MKKFKLPVEWEVFGLVEIEADTIEEAVDKFNNTIDDIDLPSGCYVDASFRLASQGTRQIEDDIEYFKIFNEEE